MTKPLNTTGPTLVPAPAEAPRTPAPAAYLGALLSVTLVAVGVIGIRDGIVATGWMGGSMWTANVVNWIDGLAFAPWMIPAGVASIVVGIVVLLVAVAPRRTTAVELSGKTSVVIAHRDIAAIAQSAARTVPGVINAHAVSKRRTVTVRADTTGQDASTVKTAVSQAVGSALSALSTAPKIVVRTRSGSQT